MGRTDSQKAVVDALRALRVARARRLAEQLECSTKTIRRALASVGYFTSINHNGAFITLREMPQFDQQGLWSYESVRFSKHGNLPQTIQQIARQAAAGATVQELEQLVGTRVHNHVSQLLRKGQLSRFFVGRNVVYAAADPRRQASQQQARQAMQPEPTVVVPALDLPPGLDALRVIQVLVDLLQRPEASIAAIARGLQARRVDVRAEQVRQILDFYRLKKTTR